MILGWSSNVGALGTTRCARPSRSVPQATCFLLYSNQPDIQELIKPVPWP